MGERYCAWRNLADLFNVCCQGESVSSGWMEERNILYSLVERGQGSERASERKRKRRRERARERARERERERKGEGI